MMFFTFSLAGASSIIGRLNLYELEASILSAQNLFANKSSQYTLNIYNPNDQRDSFALECKNEEEIVILDELKAGQSLPITLHSTFLVRGEVLLPRLQIGTHFPLPHEILFKTIFLNKPCIVYPEPKGKSLNAYSSKHFAYTGEYDDFKGIRFFKEGESLSKIYWPSLAKGQELMAKDFDLLEQSRHLHFYFLQAGENDEERLSQLCLWALECKKNSISYTMHFPTSSLDSEKRSHNEILEFLARY